MDCQFADSDDDALGAAGRALFRLGRLFGKQLGSQAAVAARPVELSRILVAEAIWAGSEEAGGEVTVGMVAERLAIEPSTASRLVAETIRDGYASRATSPADGRRAILGLTASGRALVADARRYQRDTFAQLTADWPEAERDAFARALVRFTETLSARLANPDPPARG